MKPKEVKGRKSKDGWKEIKEETREVNGRKEMSQRKKGRNEGRTTNKVAARYGNGGEGEEGGW
jgi:hypothetical protein